MTAKVRARLDRARANPPRRRRRRSCECGNCGGCDQRTRNDRWDALMRIEDAKFAAKPIAFTIRDWRIGLSCDLLAEEAQFPFGRKRAVRHRPKPA